MSEYVGQYLGIRLPERVGVLQLYRIDGTCASVTLLSKGCFTVTTFPQERLEQAVQVFKDLGFQQQHPRIYHYSNQIGNHWFHVSVGLEDSGEHHYQSDISVLQRPLPKNNLGYGSGGFMTKVIPLDTAPVAIQDKVRALCERLRHV